MLITTCALHGVSRGADEGRACARLLEKVADVTLVEGVSVGALDQFLQGVGVTTILTPYYLRVTTPLPTSYYFRSHTMHSSLLLTRHYVLFTTYCSLLTTHYSRLTT